MSNSDKDQKYKYIFKREGDIVRKPTNKDYNSAVVRKNSAFTGLEGADDYSDFAKKRAFGGYKYDLGEDNVISDFNGTAKNKRSNKKIGTAFTVSDDRVAENLYKLVAGNSNVEYAKIGYHDKDNLSIENLIKTDKGKKNISYKDELQHLMEDNVVTDITHSHPVNFSEVKRNISDTHLNTKFASRADISAYNNLSHAIESRNILNKTSNIQVPQHSVYHAWSSDKEKLPYTMNYNENGTILPNGMKIQQARGSYYDKLEMETGIKVKR